MTAAKVKIATLPAEAAIKTVKTGTAGVDRVSISNLRGDGGTTVNYTVKHNLNTLAVAASFFSAVSGTSGNPSVEVTSAERPEVKVENANELKLKFGAGKPTNEQLIWVKVEA